MGLLQDSFDALPQRRAPRRQPHAMDGWIEQSSCELAGRRRPLPL